MTEETLFQEALSRSPAERAAFLDQACAGQPELQAAVEALLAAHDKSGNLLDQPPADLGQTVDSEPNQPPLVTTTAYCPEAGPGAIIAGRYTLVEKIGEGGMGEVWVAKQTEPVKRQVALKLIKPGMDSKQVLARFEAERQALALMDHPNIAKVLDGGLTPPANAGGSPRPFFVMELVKGTPITRFCDERKLTPRQRLELFVPVCQAIQHAHHKGIMHRDIKPSNVLVALYDDRAVPKVIDFGVAKATGPSLGAESVYTAFGAIVGTPEYMSPEQASLNNLDIDTRSDVYSLGVLLYELLTGSTPVDRKHLGHAAVLEVLRIVREVETPRPSTRLSSSEALPTIAANRNTEPAKLSRLMRGELDWILLKALEKDRSRRYETANGFAMDVQRYLAGEPVLAAPASALYRLRKFVKRHKGPVVAVALVLLTLLGGIAGTTWGLVRAEQQRQVAEAKERDAVRERDAKDAALKAEQQARADEERARKQAEDERNAKDAALKAEQLARADEIKARQQAFAALHSMTADVVERKFTQGTVLTEDDRAFLRGIIAQFDAFAAIKGDDADSRAVRAEGRFRVGTMRYTLGELKQAEQDYDQALSLYKQLADDFPSRPDFRQELAKSHNNRGNLRLTTGHPKEAEQDYDQALSIRKQLAADFPNRPEFRHYLAKSHFNRGNLLQDTGRLQEAKKDYDQALSIHKHLAHDFPNRPEFRQELAKSHDNRGILLINTGHPKEAEQDYDQALSLYMQLAADFPSRPEFRQNLALSYLNRGLLLINTGRPKDAERYYDQALSIQKQLAADFPARPDFPQDLARALNSRGYLLSNTGRPKEAEKDFDQALSIQKQLAADFPSRPEFRQELAMSHLNRGVLLHNAGRLPEAEKDYDQALSIRKQLAADFPSRTKFRQGLAESHNYRGILLMDTGRLPEAEKDYDQALHLYKQLMEDALPLPDLRNELAGTCVYMARLHYRQGNWAAAKRLLLEGRPHHLAAMKDNPRNPSYRQFYHNHLTLLTQVHAGLLEQADAVRTAETRRDLGWHAPADTYDAACCLSLCVPIVAKHDKLDDKQRKEAVQFYGDAAMRLLREAVSKGYKDAAHMKKDTDLDPLRPRDDFQKLIAELEAKAKPKD